MSFESCFRRRPRRDAEIHQNSDGLFTICLIVSGDPLDSKMAHSAIYTECYSLNRLTVIQQHFDGSTIMVVTVVIFDECKQIEHLKFNELNSS